MCYNQMYIGKKVTFLYVFWRCTNEIENEVYNSGKSEIESIEIGNMVMRRLKNMDEIAYVRFASVYKEFKDIESFMEALKSL